MSNRPNAVSSLHTEPRVYQPAPSRLSRAALRMSWQQLTVLFQKKKIPSNMWAFCLSTQVYKQVGDCRDITNNLVVANAEFQSVEVSGARSRRQVS